MFDKEFPLPSLTNYQVISNHDLPAFFLGFKVYNDFEDKLFKIPNTYTPIKLLHLTDRCPYFLYGTILSSANINYKKLIDNICENEINYTLNDYNDLLSQYKLSCDTCYKHFTGGMYPIDLHHVSAFTNLHLSTIMCDFLQISGNTMLNPGGLNIFLLTKCF